MPAEAPSTFCCEFCFDGSISKCLFCGNHFCEDHGLWGLCVNCEVATYHAANRFDPETFVFETPLFSVELPYRDDVVNPTLNSD